MSEEDLAKHNKLKEEERKVTDKVEEKPKEPESTDQAPVFAIGGASDDEDD